MPDALPPRSARKREAILAAGQDLFLTHGYKGTSVDQIAAAAAVSKQTVYKHFGDKRELLLAIVSGVVQKTVRQFTENVEALAETTRLEDDLVSLAVAYLRSVLSTSVVQLRRLVIAEAVAVPELAAFYYDHAPEQALHILHRTFRRLGDRGLLTADDPRSAAEHFAFLVVGRAIDKALFFGGPQTLADLDVEAQARAGVRVFLSAYGSS
jgi:TetR/AcrR family transcriptional regulator, mexJK operon transcriptional repressor